MAEVSDCTSSELAERLRLWIVIGGYLLGGWAILQSVFTLADRGLPFNRIFLIAPLTPIYHLAAALYLFAPLALVAGCWGFQHHKRWARPLLLTYAGMWIVGVFALQGVWFIDFLLDTNGNLTLRQQFRMALDLFNLQVYASVFAVSLVLCLTRPEVRDQFPEFRSGFAPIIGGKSK